MSKRRLVRSGLLMVIVFLLSSPTMSSQKVNLDSNAPFPNTKPGADSINILLMKYARGNKLNPTISGYRLQLYYNNNQRVSKTEASQLKERFDSLYPNMGSYLQYQSPFWRLVVGNFRSYSSAKRFMETLHKGHPDMVKNAIILRNQKIDPMAREF